MSIVDLDQAYVAHTYKRFPIEIASGKGSLVTDAAGREYIDMGSGIAVTSFGVADDVWISAVEEQIRIARQKGGIREGEPYRLERFEVVRHY